jgi:transcription termination/antitermination protein NusG
MNFFALRVASNKEDQVQQKLLRKVKIEGLDTHVGRILVPSERKRSVKGGVKRDFETKLYAGYVFVELELDPDGRIPDKVWFMIKETEGVGDFIGSNGKPSPLSPKERDALVEATERKDDEPILATSYRKGDHVKVTNGPFENFEGEVDEILSDQGKVRIVTTIFNRPTPLELEYWQIEKV